MLDINSVNFTKVLNQYAVRANCFGCVVVLYFLGAQFVKAEFEEVNAMKKIAFGISLILFGFSMAYISVQAQWAIIQLVSLLSVFIGLVFSIFGFFEKEK